AFDAQDAARQHVEKLRVAIDAAVDEHERRTADRKQLAERVEELEERLARLPALREELAMLADAGARLGAAERVARIVEQLERTEEALHALPTASEDAVNVLAAAEQQWADAREAATRAEGTHERAQEAFAAATIRVQRAADADPSQPCPTCGQPLGEGFAAYLRHAKTEATQDRRALARAAKEAKGGA